MKKNKFGVVLSAELFFFAAVAMSFFSSTTWAAYNQGDHYWIAPELNSWYDSNIFRKANDDMNIAQRSDGVLQPKVSGHADIDVSRQSFFLDSAVFSRNYQKHSDLNYTGVNNMLGWNWVIGSDWSGVIQYGIAHDLSTFEDINTAQYDMYTSNNLSGSILHKLTSNWQILINETADHESHSVNDELDLNSISLGGGIRYITDKGSEIVVRRDHDAVEYNNDYYIWTAEERGYQQDTNQLIFMLPISDKLKSTLNFGQVKWHYSTDNSSDKNAFGGAELEWQATGKTKLTGSYNRQMSMPKQSLDTSMNETYKLTGTWQSSEKIGFDVSYQLNSQRYKGVNARTDDTTMYRINCNWSPVLNWFTSIYMQYQTRESEFATYIYTAETVGISLHYKY
jgi:Uncharacterized protein conserved in bacteria (DUF2320).